MKTKFTRIILFAIFSIIISIFISYGQSSFPGIKTAFKESYGKWKLSEKIQEYSPDNLYDLINGAADNYLSFNFLELLVRTYEIDSVNYINVEIYNHQNIPNAFGIYSSERPSSAKLQKIGVQGYQETGLVNFFADKYYVKLSTHNTQPETQEILYNIANDIAQIIGGEGTLPGILSNFPELNKISNSESYTNTNFLGYEFLHSAYLAAYQIKGKQFKLFIMTFSSKNDAKECLVKFSAKAKTEFKGIEGRYIFVDPHNGEIKLQWKENYIWGILNENKVKINEDYLHMIAVRLQ